jgi:energy-converting hydrogenase Eha subunit E
MWKFKGFNFSIVIKVNQNLILAPKIRPPLRLCAINVYYFNLHFTIVFYFNINQPFALVHYTQIETCATCVIIRSVIRSCKNGSHSSVT